MKVTATEIADNSKSILDHVLTTGEPVEVERHGRVLVEINRKAGVGRAEFLRLMRDRGFSETESQELKKAMDATAEVFGYAGGH